MWYRLCNLMLQVTTVKQADPLFIYSQILAMKSAGDISGDVGKYVLFNNHGDHMSTYVNTPDRHTIQNNILT